MISKPIQYSIATLVIVGGGTLFIKYLDKQLKGKEEKGSYDRSDQQNSPAWFAARLQRSFEWTAGTGGTDDELLLNTIALVRHRKQWEAVKVEYRKLTGGSSLMQQIDVELDSYEKSIVSTFLETLPAKESDAIDLYKLPVNGQLIIGRFRAIAGFIHFYLTRADTWISKGPTDLHWEQILGILETIPYVRLMPYLVSIYHSRFGESLVEQLNDRLSDRMWQQLTNHLINKVDGKGKTLTEIFTGS